MKGLNDIFSLYFTSSPGTCIAHLYCGKPFPDYDACKIFFILLFKYFLEAIPSNSCLIILANNVKWNWDPMKLFLTLNVTSNSAVFFH